MASAHADDSALEQVASYIDGMMDPEARARFVGHAACCTQCSELLVETMALLTLGDPPEPPPGRLHRHKADLKDRPAEIIRKPDRFRRGSVD
jgi:hypothetical protein